MLHVCWHKEDTQVQYVVTVIMCQVWVFTLILDIQQEQIVGQMPLVMTLQPAIPLSSFLELHMIHSTLSRPLKVVQLKVL
jgi:hypothetical protein